MKRILFFLIFIFVLYLLFRKENIDQIELNFNRFEQVIFSINSENANDKLQVLEEDFDTFNEVFEAHIIQRRSVSDTAYVQEIFKFINHPDMREAYDSVALMYDDFSDVQQELTSGFSHFHYFFPSHPIPDITTFFGGFNYGVITYDDNIAIGLENFLGKNSEFYDLLKDPKYLRFQKQRRFISSNVMEAWLNEHFQYTLVSRDFLSQMLYKGKVMYCIDKMFPDISLENKFRFTKEQMQWVIYNEANIWAYFMDNELLFSLYEQEFRTFLNYAPFAKGMPNEAPARVGYFIGYKIIVDLMKNSDMSFESMMNMRDGREILNLSKYKPSK